MLNQVSITGRCSDFERKGDVMNIIVKIYRFDDDKEEYIPVIADVNTKNRIGYLRRGDLMGVTGRLKYDNGSIVVMAERISFVG